MCAQVQLIHIWLTATQSASPVSADPAVMHSHSRCRKATDSVGVWCSQLAAVHRQKGVLLCVAAGSGAAGAAHCGGHDGRF